MAGYGCPGGHVSFGLKGAYLGRRTPDPGSCAPINFGCAAGPDFFNSRKGAGKGAAGQGRRERGEIPSSRDLPGTTDYRVPQLI
jgi:hypothetical protein